MIAKQLSTTPGIPTSLYFITRSGGAEGWRQGKKFGQRGRRMAMRSWHEVTRCRISSPPPRECEEAGVHPPDGPMRGTRRRHTKYAGIERVLDDADDAIARETSTSSPSRVPDGDDGYVLKQALRTACASGARWSRPSTSTILPLVNRVTI
jgi:hypothetical protein